MPIPRLGDHIASYKLAGHKRIFAFSYSTDTCIAKPRHCCRLSKIRSMYSFGGKSAYRTLCFTGLDAIIVSSSRFDSATCWLVE